MFLSINYNPIFHQVFEQSETDAIPVLKNVQTIPLGGLALFCYVL